MSHEASDHHSPLLLVPRSFGSVSVLSVHFILTRGAVTSAKREWRTRSEEGRRGEREPEASMSDTRRGWGGSLLPYTRPVHHASHSLHSSRRYDREPRGERE